MVSSKRQEVVAISKKQQELVERAVVLGGCPKHAVNLADPAHIDNGVVLGIPQELQSWVAEVCSTPSLELALEPLLQGGLRPHTLLVHADAHHLVDPLVLLARQIWVQR